MSLNDLAKTEKKMKWKEKRKVVVGFIVGIVLLVGFAATAFFMSGCTIRLLPVGSASQAELQRRIAIDSYKEGLVEGIMLHEDEPGPELIPPYYRED